MSAQRRTHEFARAALLALGALGALGLAACGGASAPAAWDATPAGMEPPPSVTGSDDADVDEEIATVEAQMSAGADATESTSRATEGGRDDAPGRRTTDVIDVTPAVPPVLIAGPHVTSDWLGGAWDGAPVRLAANPDALDGHCRAASQAPDDPHFAVPASAVVGAGLELPDDAWLVVSLTSIDRADDRCVSAAGARHVVEIGRGGLLVVSGPIDSGVVTPGDAMSRRDLVVHGFSGWSMDHGTWRTDGAPVWARLDVPTTARPDLCAAGLDEQVDALVAAAWARHLGSPAARSAADAALRAQSLGPSEAEHLAAAWRDGLAPADAMHRLAEADAVLAACATSPGARVVVALLEDAAGLPDAAIESLDVRGPALRSPSMRALEALLRWRAGDDAGALDALDAALDLDVDRFDVRLLRARIIRDSIRDAERARASLAALEPPPAWSATVHHELGTALDDLGEPGAAIEAWTAAAFEDPAWAEPANALGCVRFAMGAMDDARTWFATAIDRDASHASAHNNLGFLVEQVDGDIDTAEALYRRATTLDPTLASAWYNLGWLLETHRAELSSAEDAYRSALRASPGHADAAAAIARLEARPDATADALVGSWSTTVVDESGVTVILATFFGDGRVTFVERRTGGLPSARTGPLTVDDLSGARLTGRIGGEVGADVVIEFVTEDRILLFDPGTPGVRRVYDRRVGDDLAQGSRDAG